MDPEATAHAAAMQRLTAENTKQLADFTDGLRQIHAAQLAALELAGRAEEMSRLALRAMAEMSPDFRIALIRLAQEPGSVPSMTEFRKSLATVLADQQRTSGERAQLRPVPKSPDSSE